MSKSSKKYIPYFLVVVILIFGGFVINWFETIAAPTNGLVGYWNFDEGSGTTAADSSGNGNNGVLTNGPTWSAGKIGGALSFDGSNDYVNAGDLSAVENLGAFSVSLWVKPTAFNGVNNNMFIEKSGAGNDTFEFRWEADDGDVTFTVITSGGYASGVFNGIPLSTSGIWYHIVGVYNGVTVKVYVNGILGTKAQGALTGTTLNGTTNFAIPFDGDAASTHNYFNGLIDEVRIYNRALSAQEIQSLYTEGDGTPPIADTQAPTVPQNLTATAVSASQINLSWSASTDNTGVIGYRIYRGSIQIATSTSAFYSNIGLNSSTQYTYTITAYDAAGNTSLQSTMVTTQTLASIVPIPTPAPTPIPPPPSTSISPSNWVPPIGIPVPPFGIMEQAPPTPNPWTTQTPGFYYVCTNCAGATDSNNTYGTPTKPRQSPPYIIPAGSVIVLSGTIYRNCGGICSFSSPNVFTANGTAVSPVFIRGLDSNNKPKIIVNVGLGGSYTILENLEFADADGDLTGGPAGKLNLAGDHLVLRNSDLHGNLTGGGIGISGLSAIAPPTNNIVVYQNYIHDNGDVNATYDQDVHCIAVGGYVNNLWVTDNEIARCSGDGIQINSGGGSDGKGTSHHIYFGRNVTHHHKQTGFWSKTASDVIFSQNTAYGERPSNSSGGACAGYQYGPERVWFLYNHLYDCTTGIAAGSASGPGYNGLGQDIYYIGNVIHNIHHTAATTYNPLNPYSGAAITNWAGRNRYVINNTIFDVDAGINSPDSGNWYLANNIITNMTEPLANHLFLSSPGTWSLDNTLFHQGGSPARIKIGNRVYSLPQLQSTFNKGQQSLMADPFFVDPAANNFHLQSSSSAIGTGLVSSVYQTFKDLYGLDISKDFNGGIRPAGNAWDIGAYEYGSVPGPTQAPTQVYSQTPTPAPVSTPAPASTPTPLTQIPSPSTSASTPVSTPTTTQAPTPSPAPTPSSSGSGGSSSSGSAPSASGSGSYAPPVQSSPSSQTALGSVSSPTVKISTSLYLGLRHPEVEILQDLLIKQGFLTIQRPTGYFGILTQSAVGKFQEKYNIISAGGSGYGRVGSKTISKLNEISNLSVSPSSEAEKQALIQRLQLQIKILQLQLQILLLQQKLGR